MLTFPDDTAIRAALELAVRAPSVHNSQPWRFRIGTRHIQLHADPGRQLTATDPDGRDLVISCGAALHHLRVGLAALGWLPLTDRLPDPADPNHLATVEPLPRNANHPDLTLAVSIPRRHTDRRPYAPHAIPANYRNELARAAAAEGVQLHVLPRGVAHAHVLSVIAEADRSRVHTVFPMREFLPSRLHTPVIESEEDRVGTVLVLGTTDDARASWLRAGEATSAVLLAATRMRLATCPITQPLEVPATRERMRAQLLDGLMVPHMMLRIGWPPDGPNPDPVTARRPFTDVTEWVMP